MVEERRIATDNTGLTRWCWYTDGVQHMVCFENRDSKRGAITSTITHLRTRDRKEAKRVYKEMYKLIRRSGKL